MSFPAYRRLSTSIHLAGRAHSSELARVVDIAPAELAAALATDAKTREIPSLRIDRIVIDAPETKRGAGEFGAAAWKTWLASNSFELKLTIWIVGGLVVSSLLT